MSKKKVTLTIGERIYVTNLMNDFKGSLTALSSALEDVKVIVLSEDEKKAIDYKVESNRITWDASKTEGKEAELELADTTVDYLKGILEEKDKKGEFTLMDSGIVELMSKLQAL